MAASGLLSASGVSDRAGAAGGMPGAQGPAGRGAVGAAAVGVHAVVRGVGDGDGREMPVATLAGLVGESDMRIWRIVHHYVDRAVEAQNLEGVERVGIDETSSRRGHDYVSVFADLDERRGVFVVEGRDHETVQAFSLFLETHGGDPGQSRRSARTCPRRS